MLALRNGGGGLIINRDGNVRNKNIWKRENLKKEIIKEIQNQTDKVSCRAMFCHYKKRKWEKVIYNKKTHQ